MAEPTSFQMTASPPPPAHDPLFGNPVSDLLFGALEGGTSPPSSHGTEWTPPSVEHLAGLLPAFGVRALIGRGGMGAVYQGLQLSLNRPVAIKLLPAELAASAEFVGRFQREAQTLARLQHPGIVAVHDFGRTAEGHLYFIMEFVVGTDLQRIIHGPGLQPDQALELTLQICEALQFAHSQGVIHRDIKPANVLITQDGRAKLADFGLARPLTTTPGMTAASLVMGTPEYMAPEQWAGKVDHRADIYALGVMLYEMLTGTRPHGAFDLPSTKSRVDVRFDDVVIKAMRQAPEQRYQHVSELRDAVHRIRTQVRPRTIIPAAQAPAPEPARAPAPAPAPAQPDTRRRSSTADVIGWAATVVVLLALAGAGTWLLLPQRGQARQGETAGPEAASSPAGEKQAPGTVKPSPAPSLTKVEPPAANEDPPPAAPLVSVPAAPAVAAPAVAVATAPPVIEVFSREAQNLLSWAVSPLEAPTPPDVRRNLTFIREDLIDEGKAQPAASLDAYREAYYLCEALLDALDKREQARVAAGHRSAQSAANQPVGNQALDARRNYLMSWPQYSREESQRSALRGQNDARTAVAGEATKVAWAAHTARASSVLDARYRAFRAAMRK